jgi:hypothetical protein
VTVDAVTFDLDNTLLPEQAAAHIAAEQADADAAALAGVLGAHAHAPILWRGAPTTQPSAVRSCRSAPPHTPDRRSAGPAQAGPHEPDTIGATRATVPAGPPQTRPAGSGRGPGTAS